MAATKIADVIVPSVFNPYLREDIVKRSALFRSGIIQTVPALGINGLRGGTTIAMPFWPNLSGTEEVLSDTAPLGVDKITANQDVSVLNARGKAWGVNDLAEALSGDDPMAAIVAQVADYWNQRQQVQLLSMLKGVFLAVSMASNVHNISAETGEDAVIDADSFIDAVYKLGDQSAGLVAIAVHSATMAVLAKQGLIDFIVDSEGRLTIPTYMGKAVIVDDDMPVASGVYTSYIFGNGAIGYADADAPVPTETDRDSLAGEDILINRRHFVLHPRGVKWQGTPAGVSPTNVEFEVGTNWLRVYDPKNVRIVQFIHRIAAV